MEEKKKMIVGTGVIAFVIALVIEVILSLSKTSIFSIDRLIIVGCFFTFIALRYSIGKEKVYDFIIDHRFKIALILFLVTVIFGVSIVSFTKANVVIGDYNRYTNEKYVGFIHFFGMTNNTLAKIIYIAYTNFKFILMFLVNYELSLIITNDRKKAVMGMYLLSLSSYMFLELNQVIIFGTLAIVLFEKLINYDSDNKKKKILLKIGFVLSMLIYGLTFDVSSIVAFGYVIVAMFIYLLIKAKKDGKVDKMKLICFIGLIISMFFISFVFHFVFMRNGLETNDVTDIYQNRLDRLYGFVIPFLNTFKPIESIKNYTTYFSLFPVPIIIALVYLYRKEKNYEFLFPISIITVILLTWCTGGMPVFIGRILGLTLVSKSMAAVVGAFVSTLLSIYIVTNLDDRAISFNATLYLTLALVVLYFFVLKPVEYSSKGLYYLIMAIMIFPSLLLFNYKDERYNRAFGAVVVLFAFISVLRIVPITKANYLDIFKYNKNNDVFISKKAIEEYEKEQAERENEVEENVNPVTVIDTTENGNNEQTIPENVIENTISEMVPENIIENIIENVVQ